MSRDYTQEVGLSSSDVIVPWRYALPILIAMALITVVGVRAGIADQNAKKHRPREVSSVQVFIRE
jgi:hypothetical protein